MTKANSMGWKATALVAEHVPCCGASFAAGFLPHAQIFGFELHTLNHNPILEFGMMVTTAVGFEYLAHKRLCRNIGAVTGVDTHFKKHDKLKRYGIALSIGLASWGIHQKLFHHHHDEQAAVALSVPTAVKGASQARTITYMHPR